MRLNNLRDRALSFESTISRLLAIRSVLAIIGGPEWGHGSVAARVAARVAGCFSGVLRFGLGHPNEEVHRSDPQERGSEPRHQRRA